MSQPAMSQAVRSRSPGEAWRTAVSMFTIIPAGGQPTIRPATAARTEGLGALIAGATSRRARWAAAVILLGMVGLSAAAAGGPDLAARALAAVAAGLVVAFTLRRIACRRLGGMTGDVFGALIEL